MGESSGYRSTPGARLDPSAARSSRVALVRVGARVRARARARVRVRVRLRARARARARAWARARLHEVEG